MAFPGGLCPCPFKNRSFGINIPVTLEIDIDIEETWKPCKYYRLLRVLRGVRHAFMTFMAPNIKKNPQNVKSRDWPFVPVLALPLSPLDALCSI